MNEAAQSSCSTRKNDTAVQVGDGYWVAPEFADVLERAGIRSTEDLLSFDSGRRLEKPGLPHWRARVQLDVEDATGQSRTIYLKRYARPPWHEQVKRAVGAWFEMQRSAVIGSAWKHGSAWREWSFMRRLEELKIKAVRPAAYGERMAGWNEIGSAVVTEGIDGRSLEVAAQQSVGKVNRALLEQVADLVARLHKHHFFHRDLYLCHIFIDAHHEPVLIDLQRMIRPRWRRQRWIIKDLAALHYSAPLTFAGRIDRFRFLRRYLGGTLPRSYTRALIRDIRRKTIRVAKRDRRRGRLPESHRWILE